MGSKSSLHDLFPAGSVMKTDPAELGHDTRFEAALTNVPLETFHPYGGWKIVIRKIELHPFGNAARYHAAGNIREYLYLPNDHMVGYINS